MLVETLRVTREVCTLAVATVSPTRDGEDGAKSQMEINRSIPSNSAHYVAGDERKRMRGLNVQGSG
jgi:hypothetical protein